MTKPKGKKEVRGGRKMEYSRFLWVVRPERNVVNDWA